MPINVDSLLQSACEELSLVSDGDPISGDLAASAEGCLNRGIALLNSDSYISLTQKTYDITAAGNVYFRKLEPGESKPNTVDTEPPDSVYNVGRRVGFKYVLLRPGQREDIDRAFTYAIPTLWSYGTEIETAPSGNSRLVGVLRMNGNHPTDFRIYGNSKLPQYRLGDNIYLPEIYYSLLLYMTEHMLCVKYHLASYQPNVETLLVTAKKLIDTETARNRPMLNVENVSGYPTDYYYDLIDGAGL